MSSTRRRVIAVGWNMVGRRGLEPCTSALGRDHRCVCRIADQRRVIAVARSYQVRIGVAPSAVGG